MIGYCKDIKTLMKKIVWNTLTEDIPELECELEKIKR